jgi:hypothetical protein
MVLKTQYQSVVGPILRFVNSIERHTSERVLVLIPEIVPDRLGETILHNQTGILLATALRRRTDVIVSVLPFHPTFPDDDASGETKQESDT